MDTEKDSAFLLAAPKSNSGKTIVTLGLIQALRKRGLNVQPFKCGPDYIDPMHHTKIAGRPSYNLDCWMASENHVNEVFQKQLATADIGLVEGVMGLFDGAKKDEGSSAALARLLDLPVVLVVDASSVAYSVAPLLYGFKNFDKNIKLAGVIFNKVAGQSHYQFLKEAAEDAAVESLGYVPRDERLAIESRHLGLHLPGEQNNMQIVEIAAGLIEDHVDIDLLLKLSGKEDKSSETLKQVQGDAFNISIRLNPERHAELDSASSTFLQNNLKITIAKDEAFNFSYAANMDALKEFGEIRFFSPLNDNDVPESDLIWLPGGYPELFVKELANNQSMKESIKAAVGSGKAIVAECGGMMYLANELETKDGKSFPMVGVFEHSASFKEMKLHLGYRRVFFNDIELCGHEFHYSELKGNITKKADCQVKTARGRTIDMPVFRYKNCWASYMHLYLGESDKLRKFLKNLNLDV